jgi:aerobic carbon-monoxide dehydrogenase large subunit
VAVHTEHEIGAFRKRVEDPALIQGQGRYVDDLRLPGTVDVAFVHSTHAHARIARVDLSAAEQAPGVLAVWSGERLVGLPRVPNRVPIEGIKVSPLPPLAYPTVTCVGYPVAVVAATDRYLARDAAELVLVDYEPLPVVTDAERALEPDAPIIHPELGTNLAYRVVREGGDVEGAFTRAEHQLSLRLVHSRVAQIPMEPRGILAHYDRAADFLTVWRSTQSPFLTRSLLSAVLKRPVESIRVIAPDVGGAFGAKSAMYPDELCTVLLAMELDAPVRFISTRLEDFQLTVQGRDQVQQVEAAYDSDGIISALRVRSVFNVGGVLMHPGAAPPLRVTNYATGAYRIGAIRIEAHGVYTNTSPTGPYRGAGRPEAAYLVERVAEEVARKLGIDSAEVRRRNFIQPDQFPYRTPVGAVYDSGNYEAGLDLALQTAGYERLKASESGDGRLHGVGVSTTIEVSAQGDEYGRLEVTAEGEVIATTGSSSHGQGHETSFAQIIADRLNVPFEKIRIRHGDTATMPNGGGTGGSRSLVLGGGALASASEGIKLRALQVGASLLETSTDDLVYAEGGVQVVGAPERRLNLAELAAAADRGVGLPEGERGLNFANQFKPVGDAVPSGASVAVVSIDPDTGRVKLDRLITVNDCGVVVNPLIVNGQIAGGVTQAIGEAMYEKVAFDEDGQLLTASLLDYAIPTAHMVPDYELRSVSTPSPNNPLGAKGVGEFGCVTAPPAIVNAVLDALRPLGVSSIDMPVSSEKVWRAIQDARSGS